MSRLKSLKSLLNSYFLSEFGWEDALKSENLWVSMLLKSSRLINEYV